MIFQIPAWVSFSFNLSTLKATSSPGEETLLGSPPPQPNCSPFPYWKSYYILGREGQGTFLISIWFVCFDLSLPPNLALGVLGTQNISNLRVGLCFILTWFSLDFQLYSHYSIKDFGLVWFWLDDCLIVSVTIIKCKDFTTLN